MLQEGWVRPIRLSTSRQAEKFGPRVLAALILCAALAPAAARAAPITYSVTGGSVVLTVFVGGTSIGSSSSPSVSGTVTLDMAGQSLDALTISLAPNIGLGLTTPYGGYDAIAIESASLSDAGGYSSTVIGSAGGGFTVAGGGARCQRLLGGADSSGTNPPVTGIPIAYAVPSISAVVTGSPSVEINGVTLNALSGAAFGEAIDLTVLANILVTDLVEISEPSTALLVLLGLGLLGLRPRRT